MAKRNAFRAHLHRKAAGSSADVLEYPGDKPVPRGERHHVTLLAYRDQDQSPTSVQVRTRKATNDYYYYEQATPTANLIYTWDDEVVLTEGECLQVYFNGATLADDLEVWVQGWWTEEQS
jgi:hypothetical protein